MVPGFPPKRKLFPDNLKLSGNSDYNCLSGKELANSLPDKLKSMEYKNVPRETKRRPPPGKCRFVTDR
jgi:hypothetical protein